MSGSYVDDEGVQWLARADRVGAGRPSRRAARRPMAGLAMAGALGLAAVCVSARPPGPSAAVAPPPIDSAVAAAAVPSVPQDPAPDAAPGASSRAASSPRAEILPIPPVPPGIWAMDFVPLSFDGYSGLGSRELEAAAAERPGRDPDEVLRFGPMRVRRGIVETVVRAAHETGSDPALLMAIADKESSFAPAVRAKTSSAEGLYQFIDRTWLKVVRSHGPAHGLGAEAAMVAEDADGGLDIADSKERARVLALRRDPYLSAVMAAEMLKADAARIAARIGRPLTNGEIYVAHFLGPDDAERFLGSVVAKPGSVAAALLPRPARANRPIFYAAGRRKPRGLSVAQVHQKFEDMMGARTSRYQDVLGIAGLTAYAEATAP